MQVDLTEALTKGLRRDRRTQFNSMFLQEMQNLRACPHAAKTFYAVEQPIEEATLSGASITKAWPFPQLFIGKNVALLCDEAAIYSVNKSTWAITLITTKNAAQIAAAAPANKSITPGGPWHFMDFYDTVMLFNGSSVVFKTGHSSNYFTTDAVTISTGCDFKEGRAIMAGFNPSNFYALADWPTFLDGYQANLPAEISAKDLTGGAGPNWVWWSTIGGGDLLWLFSLDLMKYNSLSTTPDTGYTDENPYIFELLRLNQRGMRPMPWDGTVYRTLPLNEFVLVYGTNGASALVPFGSPVATMGIRNLAGWGTGLGIASRSAVDGGDDGHLVVDETGELWAINGEFKAERLGHREWLQPMLGDEIVVSYESQIGEWYITNGEDAYLYTENGGFCKPPWIPTAISFAGGSPVAILLEPADPDTQILKTQPFNAQIFEAEPGDAFVLEEVRITTTDIDATGWSVICYYRFSQAKDWSASTSVAFDARGVAILRVPACEAYLMLTHPDRADTNGIDHLYVKGSTTANPGSRQVLSASTPAAATP